MTCPAGAEKPLQGDEQKRESLGEKQKTMKTMFLAVAAAAAASVLGVGPAFAQEAYRLNETPARIGNVWSSFNHQPTKSQVQSAERSRGVAPSVQEENREAQIVQQLNRELLESAGADGTGAAAR